MNRVVAWCALGAVLSHGAAIARAQWGEETPMTASGGDTWGNAIAATGTTVHLVYGTGEIRYRRSVDEGANWSADRRIGGGSLHLTDPIAADGNDVWVVYLDSIQYASDWCCSRDMGSIWMRRSRDAGVTWDAPVQLSVPATAFRLSLAYAEDRLHLVWMDYRDGVWDTYYRRSPDRGVTWDPAVVIAEGVGSFGAERPQIAARGDSVHVTIWDDRGPNPSCSAGAFTFTVCPDVFHVRSLDGGASWSSIVNVAQAGARFGGRNDIAVSGSSDVVINYNADVPGETGSKLFAIASHDDGASWETPVRLTFSDNESDHGSIIGQDGVVYLVWHDDRDPNNREIYYRHTVDGGRTWANEGRVSSGAGGDSSTPLVAATPGYAHVTWIDNRSGSYQVYYRRRAVPAIPTADAGVVADAGSDAGDASDAATGMDATVVDTGGDAAVDNRPGTPDAATVDAAVAEDASINDAAPAEIDAAPPVDANLADGSVVSGPAPRASDGGCSCGVAGAPRDPDSAVGVMVLLAITALRRARRRREPRPG